MSHINYSFNQTDDSLPRDKMKLRNIASTRYSGDWPSIPHSHSYAELFYIVDTLCCCTFVCIKFLIGGVVNIFTK